MTPDFVSVRDDWTIQQVLDHIRANGSDSETLNVIYVTDDRGPPDRRRPHPRVPPPPARTHWSRRSTTITSSRSARPTSRRRRSHLFQKYDRNTLPVVDSEEKLLGIVTVDDMLDVQEEETTEDIQKLGGMEALDEPYMDAPLLRLVKKRAIWLIILFLGEMLTATAMGVYRGGDRKAVVLALFVPLIISSGGNSGSQATTLIIRAMALGEVTLRDWWRVMRKEILSGLLLGVIPGDVGFSASSSGAHFSGAYGAHAVSIGITVGLSLLGVVLWGSLCGAMLPLILRRCGLDPATSSAPFVATLVDVTGLMIYFGTAVLLLKGTVL